MTYSELFDKIYMIDEEITALEGSCRSHEEWARLCELKDERDNLLKEMLLQAIRRKTFKKYNQK